MKIKKQTYIEISVTGFNNTACSKSCDFLIEEPTRVYWCGFYNKALYEDHSLELAKRCKYCILFFGVKK